MLDMPQKSRLKLPPLNLGKESVGQRLARLRKERGYSQIALADKMGITQQLVTAYERDTRRLHAEMVIRFANALEVSTDNILLGERKQVNQEHKISLKLMRRLQKVEQLSDTKQKALLQTIDMFLQASGLGA